MRIDVLDVGEQQVENVASMIYEVCKERQCYSENELIKEYQCLPTQNWMYKYGLSDCIDIEIPVKKKADGLTDITNSICKVYEQVGLLRSCVKRKTNSLYFNEYMLQESFVIPLVCMEENKKPQLVKKLNELLSKDYCEDLPETILSHVYILETEFYYSVIFSLSHIVSDGASELAVMRLFRMAARGKNIKDVPSYADYIEMVRTKNSNPIIIDRYVDEMIGINEKMPIITPVYGQFKLEKLQTNDDCRWIDVIIRAVYHLGKVACLKYNLPRVVVKTTVNAREFYGEKYNLLVGDCHSNMFMIVDNDGEFDSFKEKAWIQINEFYKKSGMDFTYLRLKDFDFEKKFDKNNKYQKLADTTKFAIAVNAISQTNESAVLERLNEMAMQRAGKKEAFGDYYRICATVFQGSLYIQMPEGLNGEEK